MRIAVLSDTHDNERNTRRALDLVRDRGAEVILHCGDVCRVSTALLFDAIPTHFVRGNNDFDIVGLQAAVEAIGGFWHGPIANVEIGGRRIAMLHGDDYRQLKSLIEGGGFDYVFFGHSHAFQRNHTGRTTVLNPGALHRASPKTFVVIDLQDGSFELLKVAE